MPDYQPTYEFYETAPDLLAGNPVRTFYGDQELNWITEADFAYHRHGGCTQGRLACTYELTTVIRDGWYVVARLHPEGPIVYAGRVYDRKHKYLGPAEIITYGFISYWDEVLVSDFAGEDTQSGQAVAALADLVRPRILPFFFFREIAYALLGEYRAETGDFPAGSFRSIREQIAQIAATSGDLFYGFFPDGTIDAASMPEVTSPLAFTVLQGTPPVGAVYSIGGKAEISSRETNRDSVYNSLILSGSDPESAWMLDDTDSIQAYGRRMAFVRKEGITTPVQAQRLLSQILAVAKEPAESWTVNLHHSNTTGDSLNFIENGLPFPWSYRLQLMDHSGAALVTNAPSYAMKIKMAGALSVEVSLGQESRDLASTFELGEWQDVAYAPNIITRNEPTAPLGPAGFAEPPVGFFLNQKIMGGVSKPSITEAKWRYDKGYQDNYQREVLDWDWVRANVDPFTGINIQNIPKTTAGDTWTANVVTDYFTLHDCMEFLGWGGTPTIGYLDAAGTYTGIQSRQMGEGLTFSSGWEVYYSPRGQNWLRHQVEGYVRANMIGYQPELSKDARMREAADGEFRFYFHTPLSLILHHAGTLKESLGAGSNWEYFRDTYGFENVLSVPVERFPYSVTYDGTPSGYLPADYASRAVYFTPSGAAAAVAATYFWEEIIVFDPVASGAGYLLDVTFPRLRELYREQKVRLQHFTSPTPEGIALEGIDIEDIVAANLANPFKVRLIRKKREITALTRIAETAHRDPKPGETTPSLTYGLPRFRQYEYRIRGYDDEHASEYVNHA